MDDDVKFTLKLGGTALVVLALVLVLFQSLYDHPMPEKDCSKPYDYPLCKRAYDVGPWRQPSLVVTFLYALMAGLMMAGLVYVSFKSCVFNGGSNLESAQKNGKKGGK